MAIFQSRKIQSITVFIIALVSGLWLFQGNITAIKVFQDTGEPAKVKDKTIPHLERIDYFVLKEYTADHVLANYIEADTYLNYKDAPIQLLSVKVTTYDGQGQAGFVLKSNRANYLKTGEIFLNGAVNIESQTGVTHEIQTESLIVYPNISEINSNREVTYLGENAKILAQGMKLSTASDTMILDGDVTINQDVGSVIKTKNLFVNQADGKKHYLSQEGTTYLSAENTITSKKGMDLDMNQDLMQLLGKVEVLQKSGSTIISHHLLVDQSNGGEIYKSDDTTHYQSQVADILAQSMYYDAKTQVIELTGGVKARYE